MSLPPSLRVLPPTASTPLPLSRLARRLILAVGSRVDVSLESLRRWSGLLDFGFLVYILLLSQHILIHAVHVFSNIKRTQPLLRLFTDATFYSTI